MKTYKKYKDSGIEWIGGIPEHWEVKRLKFVAINQPSNVDKKSKEGEEEVFLCNYVDVYKNEFIDDSLQYMKATATDAQIKKFILEKGDVLATKDSEDPSDIAVPALVTKDFENVVCGYHLTMMKPIKDKLVGGFLFRLLQSDSYRSYFEIMANGVTRYGLSTGAFNNLEVVTPSVEEQTQIAQFLDQKTAELDQAIALKEELIALLKEERAALINEAVTKGIDSNVSMKDSGIEWIGKIPEHWEMVRMKCIVNAIGDINHYMPPTIESGIPYVMTGNLEEFVSNIDFERCKKVSQIHYNNLSKKIKNTKGDLILARYATIGTVCYVDIDMEFLVSYSCVTIKPNSSKLLGLYLFYFFKSSVFIIEIGKQVNSNTQGNVGIQDLKEIKIVLPPIQEQKELVKYIEIKSREIDQEIKLTEEEINLLKEYRQSLISEAVTGKIDLRDYALESVA